MTDFGIWICAVGVALCSAGMVRVARNLALRRAILDHPNERSSHKNPVPRLGGSGFIPIILTAVGFLAPVESCPALVLTALLGGSIALYGVSLGDDILSLSASVRFAVQFAAAGAFLWSALYYTAPGSFDFLGVWFSLGTPSHRFIATLSYGVLIIWVVGTVNIYNFMDGIDGVAGVQAVVTGISWGIFGRMLGASFVAWAGAMIAAGALGFLTLNWPPAKIFMGDAGSTVLGYLFAAFPVVVTIEAKGVVAFDLLLIAAALLLWPFLIDGTFTILRRLTNGENILKAHRSHLYQRLVISGRSHAQVTCVYGCLALVGAGLAWSVLENLPFAVPVAMLVVGVLFLALWLWVVRSERTQKNASEGERERGETASR